MLGYKHTMAAIEKMRMRFKDKSNHPLYGKKHTSPRREATLLKISKPGALNPMFGQNHTEDAKQQISVKLSN